MSLELALASGARLRLTREADSLLLVAGALRLELTREEAWRLAEALDRLATAGEC